MEEVWLCTETELNFTLHWWMNLYWCPKGTYTSSSKPVPISHFVLLYSVLFLLITKVRNKETNKKSSKRNESKIKKKITKQLQKNINQSYVLLHVLDTIYSTTSQPAYQPYVMCVTRFKFWYLPLALILFKTYSFLLYSMVHIFGKQCQRHHFS